MIKEEDKELFLEQYKNYMLYQTKSSFVEGKQKEIYELAAISNLLSIFEIRKKIESYNPGEITEESNFFDIFSKIQIYRQLKRKKEPENIEQTFNNKIEHLIEENNILKQKLNSIESVIISLTQKTN